MSDDGAEKEHEPTQHKLDEARKRGEFVRSPEVSVAASYGGFLIAAVGFGGIGMMNFGTRAMVFLDQSDSLSILLLAGQTGPLVGAIGGIIGTLAVLLLLPGVAVLALLLAQRAMVFAPEKLMPRLSRINPIANAGQKFGRAGIFEFAKSLLKLCVIAAVLGRFMLLRTDQMLMTQYLSPATSTVSLLQLIAEFLFLVLMISVVISVIDYLWQRQEHLRRNRMSRQELVDEMKHSEGDPHTKAQRRQRAVEIATNRMLSDVPKADVIVVNPTHYAVALKWERGKGRAPVCLAKGVDEVAARIRAAASEAGVPIHSDAPTARALFAAIEIGHEIRPEHYKPVAAAIRFAEKIRRRAVERKGW